MTQTAIKERGISFTTWSIPKIKDRTKTQTRRTYGLEEINKSPNDWVFVEYLYTEKGYRYVFNNHRVNETVFIKCPYGQVGDRLWVKETWNLFHYTKNETGYCDIEEEITPIPKSKPDYNHALFFKATGDWDEEDKWRSPLFMPRWASRIDLEITEVRAERLQEITEGDAKREGDPQQGLIASENSHTVWFQSMWDSLNAKRGFTWEANPWVWVIGFKGV